MKSHSKGRELQQFQVALKAFVVRGERLLMVREADGAKLWELPGGRIEVGEDRLLDVLSRELAEELGAGFAVDVIGPAAGWIRPPDPSRRTLPVFLLGFECRHRGGEPVLSGEHVELAWATRAESVQLELAPGYAGALARFWLRAEVIERRWAPGEVVETHTHPFDARALVTAGELWLTHAGETRHLRAGDTFHVPEGAPHSERYGAGGATYWVARSSPLPCQGEG